MKTQALLNQAFKQVSLLTQYLPLTITLVTIAVFVQSRNDINHIVPYFTKLEKGELTKSQELAINMTMEINKYVISIGAGLFGLVGFYFNNYVKHLTTRSINLAFLLALSLLGLGGYYAFIIYTELINCMSQGVYAMYPGGSTILAYIELEFILCLGASLTLGSIFISVQFIDTAKKIV